MSLRPHELKRLIKIGNKDAKKIYPLRKNGNLLLCTILLGNVAVNAAIAIFLSSLTTGLIGGIISTGLIVLFGEIIPQAAFSKHALKFGGKTIWLMWASLIILYPVAKPIALVLDKALGKELPRVIKKKEIDLLIAQQEQLKGSDIDKDDYVLISRGLKFGDQIVEKHMNPMSKTFLIEKTAKLTPKLINLIHSKGHSRIPVYSQTKDRIVGILYAKDLITLDPEDDLPVTKIMRKNIDYVRDINKLDTVLEKFKHEKKHLFIVRNKNDKVIGIITLEDVLEEIIGEIQDEYDKEQK